MLELGRPPAVQEIFSSDSTSFIYQKAERISSADQVYAHLFYQRIDRPGVEDEFRFVANWSAEEIPPEEFIEKLGGLMMELNGQHSARVYVRARDFNLQVPFIGSPTEHGFQGFTFFTLEGKIIPIKIPFDLEQLSPLIDGNEGFGIDTPFGSFGYGLSFSTGEDVLKMEGFKSMAFTTHVNAPETLQRFIESMPPRHQPGQIKTLFDEATSINPSHGIYL